MGVVRSVSSSNSRITHFIKKCKATFLLFGIIGCVEPVSFEVPPASSLLVVEGYVSSSDGSHTVKLSRATNIESDTLVSSPVTEAIIDLYENDEIVARFNETLPGNYQIDKGQVTGVIGSDYHIKFSTMDGSVYESLPDKLQAVGQISEVHLELEHKTRLTDFGETDASAFNVLVDSKSGPLKDAYIRWRYSAFYGVDTYPSLYMRDEPPYTPFKDPWPCSGYIVVEGPPGSGGKLEQIGDCTCCECWGKISESAPTLSNDELVRDGEFYNVFVGQVPITPTVFQQKVMLQVEQMSLNRAAFDFFDLIRSQKENTQSIFQPATGELRGNVRAENKSDAVIGIFYATSINTAVLFVDSTNVPYKIPEETFLTLPCAEITPNATYEMPELWE